MLSLVHSFFGGGLPGTPDRIAQLPRVTILSPTLITELENPATIDVRWRTEWTRWDGKPYTRSYASSFAESENDLVYVPMYSRDNGTTWLAMLDDQPIEAGRLPWLDGVGPDPARTLPDLIPGGDEVYAWAVPADKFAEGSYLVRVEAHRANESLHYAQHMEKIYVNR